jgi:predicted proteasome-type protease
VNGLGPIWVGVVHEQSPWTTHNGLRFAVEALSGGFQRGSRPRLLTIYAGNVESVRVALYDKSGGSDHQDGYATRYSKQ